MVVIELDSQREKKAWRKTWGWDTEMKKRLMKLLYIATHVLLFVKLKFAPCWNALLSNSSVTFLKPKSTCKWLAVQYVKLKRPLSALSEKVCVHSVWWHKRQISLYNMWSYAIPGNSTVSQCNKSGPVFNHSVTICNHCATMTNSEMLTSPHTHVKWANSDEWRRVSHVVNVTTGRKSAF